MQNMRAGAGGYGAGGYGADRYGSANGLRGDGAKGSGSFCWDASFFGLESRCLQIPAMRRNMLLGPSKKVSFAEVVHAVFPYHGVWESTITCT